VTARLDGGAFILRGWQDEDRDSLVAHANNRNVWRNLKDRFPHPYADKDADAWLALARAQPDWLNWAVVVDGAAVGCIGLQPQADVHASTAHIGYWLGEPFWGRGIMTAAVSAIADHAFSPLGFKRIETPVFAWNPASMRVLEKCGFVREGVMAKSVFKDGELIDSMLYARVVP
jgi:RimJ/RimL family protein N-acetyltransferase